MTCTLPVQRIADIAVLRPGNRFAPPDPMTTSAIPLGRARVKIIWLP